jgi:hypothetical protein
LWQLASLNGLEDANVVPGEDLAIVADSDDDLMSVLVLEFDRDISGHLMIVLGEDGALTGDRVRILVEDVDEEDLVLVMFFHCPTKLIYCGTLASFKSGFFSKIRLADRSDIRTIVRIEWDCPGAITHPTRITFCTNPHFFIDLFGKVGLNILL